MSGTANPEPLKSGSFSQRARPQLILCAITILPSLSEDGVEELLRLKNQGLTMKDLIGTGRVRIIEQSALSLHLEFDYMGLLLSEIMRADIDGDGVEDILVGKYEYANGGTYGAGSALLITRSGPNELFALLPSVQLTPEREQRLLPDGAESLQLQLIRTLTT